MLVVRGFEGGGHLRRGRAGGAKEGAGPEKPKHDPKKKSVRLHQEKSIMTKRDQIMNANIIIKNNQT